MNYFTYALNSHASFALKCMLSLAFALPSQAFAQAGTNYASLSYHYTGFTDQISETQRHMERNHVLGLTYWIDDQFALNLNANFIRSNLEISPNERSSAEVYRLTFRYNPIPKSRVRPFLELGAAIGNYCPYGRGLPILIDNLQYITYGAGIDYRLTGSFAVGIHFQSNNVLNHVEDKYAYNIFTLGATFQLPPTRLRKTAKEQ